MGGRREKIWGLAVRCTPTAAMSLSRWRTRKIDPQYIACYEKLLPERGFVVDVGARKGLMSWIALRKGNTVTAFEPDPDNCRYLRALGVDCRPVALSNGEGRQKFHVVGSGVTTGRRPDAADRLLDVRTVRMDDEVDYVDFIRFDVGGAERRVLEGARSTIERFRPRLFMELDVAATGTEHLNAIMCDLAVLGYGYRILDAQGLVDPADFAPSCRDAGTQPPAEASRFRCTIVFDAPRRIRGAFGVAA